MASPYLTLLEALRAHCELPAFPDPIPSNQLSLELKGGPSLTIDFKEETGMVILFTELGKYKPEEELEILKKIAQANFLWAATSGGTLSARPETQTLYFAYQSPISTLEGEDFIHLVEKFVDTTSQWISILSKGNSSEPAPAASSKATPQANITNKA